MKKKSCQDPTEDFRLKTSLWLVSTWTVVQDAYRTDMKLRWWQEEEPRTASHLRVFADIASAQLAGKHPRTGVRSVIFQSFAMWYAAEHFYSVRSTLNKQPWLTNTKNEVRKWMRYRHQIVGQRMERIGKKTDCNWCGHGYYINNEVRKVTRYSWSRQQILGRMMEK